MFYRVEIRLNFKNIPDTDDLMDKALDFLDQAIIVNPGQDNEERGYVELQQCFHDEEPLRPCEVLNHIEP